METNSNRDPAAARRAMSGGGASPIIRVRRDSGFYDNLPWDHVEYWSDEGTFPLPTVGQGPHLLYNFQIPAGTILDLTSAVFRLLHRVGPPAAPLVHAFMHDGACAGVNTFTLKIGGTSLTHHAAFIPAVPNVPPQDIYWKLNQDIMVPQLPFHVILRPGQNLVSEILFADPVITPPFYTGEFQVEFRGLMMAKGLFDKLAKEFGS